MTYLIALFLLVGGVAHAQCIPENNLIFPSSSNTGISKQSYNWVLDRVEAYYAPRVKARGKRLQINRLWEDGTVNAAAYQGGDVWFVDAYGGLARFPGMTTTAFALVTCHEMGHHLGGAPKYTSSGSQWASNEGQADYFATLQCMKRLGIASGRASIVLSRVFARLAEDTHIPRSNTPDMTVVRRTYNAHPNAQCRLDTYLAGRLCPANGNFSPTNPRPGSCYRYTLDGYYRGSRPRCWFAP